jgi:hypothetical protein
VPDVRLVDLDVIKRFSLALRRDTAPAEEILEALDASRAVVLAALGTAGAQQPRRPVKKTVKRTPAAPRQASKPTVATKKTAKPVAKRRASGS